MRPIPDLREIHGRQTVLPCALFRRYEGLQGAQDPRSKAANGWDPRADVREGGKSRGAGEYRCGHAEAEAHRGVHRCRFVSVRGGLVRLVVGVVGQTKDMTRRHNVTRRHGAEFTRYGPTCQARRALLAERAVFASAMARSASIASSWRGPRAPRDTQPPLLSKRPRRRLQKWRARRDRDRRVRAAHAPPLVHLAAVPYRASRSWC
jgi:hypothetical protein